MNDLKAIHVEGKMTLIFDENVSLTFEETKETTVETDDMPTNVFSQFLEALFEESKMSSEERAKVMQMTVAEFSALCDKMRNDEIGKAYQEKKQAGQETVTEGIPKQHFLQHLVQQRCPKCRTAGRLKIVDGILICDACGHNFGDIDDLPTLM
jgi:DNA-binding ferritin-like protein (Dps family)